MSGAKCMLHWENPPIFAPSPCVCGAVYAVAVTMLRCLRRELGARDSRLDMPTTRRDRAQAHGKPGNRMRIPSSSAHMHSRHPISSQSILPCTTSLSVPNEEVADTRIPVPMPTRQSIHFVSQRWCVPRSSRCARWKELSSASNGQRAEEQHVPSRCSVVRRR